MAQDTRDVAAEYWGQGAPRATDIHGLGAPPRAVTIAMEEYVRAKHGTGPWVALIVCLAIFAVPPALIFGGGLHAAGIGAVAVALIVAIRRLVERRRKHLRWFLEHAELRHATIQKVDAVIVRPRSPVARAAVGDSGRYTLVLAVDGHPTPVRLVTTDTGLGNLIEPGQRIEVLMHPEAPELVITTAELPSS